MASLCKFLGMCFNEIESKKAVGIIRGDSEAVGCGKQGKV